MDGIGSQESPRPTFATTMSSAGTNHLITKKKSLADPSFEHNLWKNGQVRDHMDFCFYLMCKVETR